MKFKRRNPITLSEPLLFIIIILLQQLHYFASATLSDSFLKFVREEYGADIEKAVARLDLGTEGSFGGDKHIAGTRTKLTKKYRILLKDSPGFHFSVHGLTGIAGFLKVVKDYFLARNYTEAELYATTYGFGPIGAVGDSMKCDHVRKLRYLIHAVRKFTNRTVDVIAYSMGCPIARKAVLGGMCVDTGENVGGPLTAMVKTFVGVAGPNFGARFLCPSVVPNTPCDPATGMVCDSAFLKDINMNSMKERYEATNRIYTIYSSTDEIVGYKVCDDRFVTGAIPSQDYSINITDVGFTHMMTILDTVNLQYDLLQQNLNFSNSPGNSLNVHFTLSNFPYLLDFSK